MAISVCKEVTKLDYLINMPVLKGHCQTSITCALKNLKGCIPNKEKRRFHTMGLHKPIGYLNAIIKQNLIIVDGIIGDLNFEEGGNPVQMNRIIVGKDPVKVDSYCLLYTSGGWHHRKSLIIHYKKAKVLINGIFPSLNGFVNYPLYHFIILLTYIL